MAHPIICMVNLEIGGLSPPLGLNLFVASTVFENPTAQVIRSVIMVTILMLVDPAVVSYFPWLGPGLLGR